MNDARKSDEYGEFYDEAVGAKYVVGIDLGTTNCELAYMPIAPVAGFDVPRILDVPQFTAPSTVERRPALPSVLYVGPEEERGTAEWRLPWTDAEFDAANNSDNSGSGGGKDAPNDGKTGKNDKTVKNDGFFRKIFGAFGGEKTDAARPSGETNPNAFYLVGEIARRRAADFPERTVASAKSWLTHSKVDRRTPILPWGVPGGAGKVSPVEASRRYLAHLASAWNSAFPDAPLVEQRVVLTVPASFDASACELTREAAFAAGLDSETTLLLEEPQAALYAWLADRGSAWRKELVVGDVVLVCDVGGGTTDLSLIRVEESDGDLTLNRVAVGRRLLLGGDNIDLALANRAAELFAANGTKLNPWQSGALWSRCRDAKEYLLRDDAADGETFKIAVLGRSSRMIGAAETVDFPKADATKIAVDGFFPICSLDDRPKRRSTSGLRETGLPYEADAAISRHIASFLRERVDESGAPIRPTRFLLNGGVFKARPIAARFEELLRVWFPEAVPTNLNPDADLDSSVARGAAYYALAKLSGGVRVRGASARSYYIGIETSGPAIPGFARPLKALCVAPVGMEEGTERLVPSEAFELVVGEPAVFRFFSSTRRPNDQPGDSIDYVEPGDETEFVGINDNAEADEPELVETDPIETTLDAFAPEETDESGISAKSGKKNDVDAARFSDDDAEYVATRFRSVVNELGALEIWCEEVGGPRRWKLEFSVRED